MKESQKKSIRLDAGKKVIEAKTTKGLITTVNKLSLNPPATPQPKSRSKSKE